MSEQVFNTVFERGRRAGAARTGTAHVQRHHAVLIAVKNNIAAVSYTHLTLPTILLV